MFLVGAGLLFLAVGGCFVGYEIHQRNRYQETVDRTDGGLQKFIREIRLEPTSDKDLRLAPPSSTATGRFMIVKNTLVPLNWNGQSRTWDILGVPTEFGSSSYGVFFTVEVRQRRALLLAQPEVIVSWRDPLHDSLRPLLDQALGGRYRITLEPKD